MRNIIDPDDIAPLVDSVIRRVVDDVVRNKILPRARDNAPGGMSSAIKPIAITVVGNGVYEYGLKAPKRYESVEKGSGVYGPTGEAYIVTPKKAGGVLRFENGGFARSAEVQGQVGRQPMQNALDAYEQEIYDRIMREVYYGISF